MTVLNIPAGTQKITLLDVNNALTTQRLNIETITEIIIPESVTVIASNAFNGCRSLSSIVIPENVTEIGGSAFSRCYSLTSLKIPDCVMKISAGAFNSCKSLTSLKIPESVTWIGKHAFHRCRSLTSIVIPENVTEIGEGAFEGCINLKTIYVSDMLADKGKDYWAQRGIDTDSVTLIRHSKTKTWVKQQGLCVSYNIHNQIALYEVCQRQFNQEQIPDIFFEIPYADLIKLTGYHNNALLLKIPRTLNRLDDINYTELCLFKRRNSISTIPLKLFEFLTIKEVYNVLKAHLPSAKNEAVKVIKAK